MVFDIYHLSSLNYSQHFNTPLVHPPKKYFPARALQVLLHGAAELLRRVRGDLPAPALRRCAGSEESHGVLAAEEQLRGHRQRGLGSLVFVPS